MRLLIFEKTKTIKEDGGTEFSLSYPDDVNLQDGKVTILNFEFGVNPIAGGQMHLDFKASQSLAENGVLLLGAYQENGRIRASFMALDGDVAVEKDVPLLSCIPVERVAFRQVKPLHVASNNELTTIEIETPKQEDTNGKKSRKKKKE